MIRACNLLGVIVDLDSGTVTDTNVVFIPEDIWEEVNEAFCAGQMTDQDVIDFAAENGVRPFIQVV